MRRVLSTHGRVIAAGTDSAAFYLPRQGVRFNIRRVFFGFTADLAEIAVWWFSLLHFNGASDEIARSSTASSLEVSANYNEGRVHFFSTVLAESRVVSGTMQYMPAPIGEGFWVETNDQLCVSFDTADLANALTIGPIFWECDFEGGE